MLELINFNVSKELNASSLKTLEKENIIEPLRNLQLMFSFGIQAMNKTHKKYNRYTKFAFAYLDQLLLKINNNTLLILLLWEDMIFHIDFIQDFLQRDIIKLF